MNPRAIWSHGLPLAPGATGEPPAGSLPELPACGLAERSGFLRSLFGPWIWAGAALGALFWLVEAVIHAHVLGTGALGEELLGGSFNELWMRALTVALFVVLGAGAQVYTTRIRHCAARARLLARAVEQAGEAVVVTDTDGSIRYANPAFSRVTGYDLEEVLSKRPSVLKSGAHGDAFYRALWDTIRSGRVWSGAIVDRRADGTYYPAALTVAPVAGERGEITSYVGIQRDMSEQAELEERLHHAEKMEALGTLVGGIAHDFNNALATILASVELARRGGRAGADVGPDLDRIGDAVEGASAMVSQLLAFARKSGPEEPTAEQEVDLRVWVERVWPLLRESVPESIRMELRLPEGPLRVCSDPFALQQVLTNLVQNARDALLEQGGGAIRVEVDVVPDGAADMPAARRLAGVPAVRVLVNDDGPGIAPERQQKVFEPFYTTKAEGHGTGLGLAMARETVRRLGGEMDLESAPGEGTTFRVVLPACDPASAPARGTEAG